ncbi:unnamed protein product [Cylindrotheca closterium]|uniref:Uncharacterized protein n=1 Tax=Cylindrotheca closterium TaxID=2856 RepID=A0AAD2FG78_9STRA|nr:unnamed protein product [Cylindrotheca closterium]
MLEKPSKSVGDPSKQSNEGHKKRGTDGGRKKEGKPKKKKAKMKHPSGEHVDARELSVLESAALPQGQIMAQFLSTFNRLEQSRFEAFRRSTFSSDAISKYVAQILIEGLNDGIERNPVLSHLCSVGQASEITMVVSTLAKAYAQRLMQDSRSFAGIKEVVLPRYMLLAMDERNSQGTEIDFFLQNAATSSSGSSLCNRNYSSRRLAAIRLQELYEEDNGSKPMNNKALSE